MVNFITSNRQIDMNQGHHGQPKINLCLPESKQMDPNNMSQFETPISVSVPCTFDISNPDISLLTNSCLNISNNNNCELPVMDFGQNNHKKLIQYGNNDKG